VSDKGNRHDYGLHGFFGLRTPQDLLKKLEREYGRLVAAPFDSDAAWNFFVTANHLVDWIWPSASAKQQAQERRADAIPRICEHLANGAKHFSLDRPHTAVLAATRIPPARAGVAVNGLSRSGLLTPALVVRLQPDEATALSLDQDVINAVEFAAVVLDYWKRRVGA
jgi:hypothetical protein